MIKKVLIASIAFLLLTLPQKLMAQDIGRFIKEAQQLEAAFKEKEALDKYSQVLKIQPNNITALCKSSELNNLLGRRQSKDKQKEYYKTAVDFAQRALKVNPNSSEANFVMAMAMGRMALISSGEEKIKAVKDIRYYAERCIQIDPANFKGYHVLGKWNFEVSDLSTLERWLVKITYGGLPKASLADAISNYEKSRQLNPRYVLNYLELAKAYKRKGDQKKAIEMLNAMMKLPNTSSDDPKIKSDGQKLLEEWK
jgi:tetratricopeptide (TPR) repeat protein